MAFNNLTQKRDVTELNNKLEKNSKEKPEMNRLLARIKKCNQSNAKTLTKSISITENQIRKNTQHLIDTIEANVVPQLVSSNDNPTPKIKQFRENVDVLKKMTIVKC